MKKLAAITAAAVLAGGLMLANDYRVPDDVRVSGMPAGNNFQLVPEGAIPYSPPSPKRPKTAEVSEEAPCAPAVRALND